MSVGNDPWTSHDMGVNTCGNVMQMTPANLAFLEHKSVAPGWSCINSGPAVDWGHMQLRLDIVVLSKDIAPV